MREEEHWDYIRHRQGSARRWWQCRWGEGRGTTSNTAGKQLGGDIRHVLWLGVSSEPGLLRYRPLWCPQEQAMPCTHGSPLAQWHPGTAPVAGESPPGHPSFHCRPGTISLPFLAASQSILAGQPTGSDGQQPGERYFLQRPEHPSKGSPQDGLGCPHPMLSLLFPLEMDSRGFRGKMLVWARGRGEKVLHEIHQSLPCPSPGLPFPRLRPLTQSLAPGRSLDLPVCQQICS